MKMDESEMKRKGKSEGGNGQIEYSENKSEGENKTRLVRVCPVWAVVS